LVVDGNFTDAANWLFDQLADPASCVCTPGVGLVCTAALGFVYQIAAPMTTGAVYRVSFTIAGFVAGTVGVFINNGAVSTADYAANGTWSENLVSTDNTADAIAVAFNNAFTGVVTGFSINELL
jgi:hypothetical protein